MRRLAWLLKEQSEGFIVGVGPDALSPLREGVPLSAGVHVQIHAGHVVQVLGIHLLYCDMQVNVLSMCDNNSSRLAFNSKGLGA